MADVRLINANALEVKWFDCHACENDCDIEYVDWRDIEKSPTIDAVPVVHARWVDNHCTACGMMPMGAEMWEHLDETPPRMEFFMSYCPCCGAKMDGGAEG